MPQGEHITYHGVFTACNTVILIPCTRTHTTTVVDSDVVDTDIKQFPEQA